jgi:hypothetical protein
MQGRQKGNSIGEPSTNWSTHRIAWRLNGQKSQAQALENLSLSNRRQSHNFVRRRKARKYEKNISFLS